MKKGFLDNIPFVKDIQRSIDKLMGKYDIVEVQIDKIEGKLDSARIGLFKRYIYVRLSL